MARGSADFSNTRNVGIAHSVPAASELLNRPDGIISLDVRGQCIFYNDFEDGNADGIEAFLNTPNYIGIAVNNVYPGNFSFRMSTNATAGSNCSNTNRIPYNKLERVGLEAILYCNDTNTQIRHKLHYYDGVNFNEAIVRFDTNDGKTYIVNQLGSFVDISSLVNHDFPRAYYQQVKLIVDFTTNKYVRLLLNGSEIDLSQYFYKQSASSAKKAIEYQFRNDNVAAGNSDLYVDNVIVTIQEP